MLLTINTPAETTRINTKLYRAHIYRDTFSNIKFHENTDHNFQLYDAGYK